MPYDSACAGLLEEDIENELLTLQHDPHLKELFNVCGLRGLWTAVQQRSYPDLWSKAAIFVLGSPTNCRSDTGVIIASRMLSNGKSKVDASTSGDLRLRLSCLKPNLADLLPTTPFSGAWDTMTRSERETVPTFLYDYLRENSAALELLNTYITNPFSHPSSTTTTTVESQPTVVQCKSEGNDRITTMYVIPPHSVSTILVPMSAASTLASQKPQHSCGLICSCKPLDL